MTSSPQLIKMPQGTQISILEDCLETIIDYRGKSPRKTTKGIPLITARIIKDGQIRQPTEFIAEEDYDTWMSRGLPRPGDIVFTTEAPCGEVAQLDNRKVALAQRVLLLRGKTNILDNRYLKWILRSDLVSFQLNQRSTGSTVVGIRQKEFRRISIPIPPLSEQHRIAEVLDRAEALRAKRRAALAKLNTLTQSIFLDLFGDPATCAKRFPTDRLGAVTTFIDYRGISPNKQPSGIRLVTARNIKRGWFEEEPQEFIPADEYVSWMRRGMPHTGDVLFTTEGHTLGSAAQLPHFQKVALAQRLIALHPSEQLRSEYLLQVILDRAFQDEVFRRATGSAARGISSKQLAEIVIALPPIGLQQEFARRVEAVEKQKVSQRTSLAKLDALFASLQHRAFSGEL